MRLSGLGCRKADSADIQGQQSRIWRKGVITIHITRECGPTETRAQEKSLDDEPLEVGYEGSPTLRKHVIGPLNYRNITPRACALSRASRESERTGFKNSTLVSPRTCSRLKSRISRFLAGVDILPQEQNSGPRRYLTLSSLAPSYEYRPAMMFARVRSDGGPRSPGDERNAADGFYDACVLWPMSLLFSAVPNKKQLL
eukprot:1179101-Prorocentrum_minimum.AAC.3